MIFEYQKNEHQQIIESFQMGFDSILQQTLQAEREQLIIQMQQKWFDIKINQQDQIKSFLYQNCFRIQLQIFEEGKWVEVQQGNNVLKITGNGISIVKKVISKVSFVAQGFINNQQTFCVVERIFYLQGKKLSKFRRVSEFQYLSKFSKNIYQAQDLCITYQKYQQFGLQQMRELILNISSYKKINIIYNDSLEDETSILVEQKIF